MNVRGILRLTSLVGLVGIVDCTAESPELSTRSSNKASTGDALPARVLGLNLDPKNPKARASVADLRGVGARAVRFVFKAPDALDAAFAAYDATIREYADAGIKILLLLNQDTIWRGATSWPEYTPRFAERAGQIAKHYGGAVHAFEIWNEPDLADGAPVPPDAFGVLVSAAYDAIKQRSQAKVVTGGLGAGQARYVEGMGDFRADAIGTHPYLQWFGDGRPEGYYDFADHLAAFEKFGKRLWFTEWGTDIPELQADVIGNVFENIPADDRIEEAYFFSWSDANHPGTGLTTDGASKRASYAVFQDFAKRTGVAPTPNGEKPPTPPTPAPNEPPGDLEAPLEIRAAMGADLWIVQCNENKSSERVWKTTADKRAPFQYPQRVTTTCGSAQRGIHPLILTSFAEGDLSDGWILQCTGTGRARAFRIAAAVDGHPAATYDGDKSEAGCR